MRTIALVAGVLHISLLLVTYLLLPNVVSPEMLAEVKHWVLVSFSAIFLILVMIDERKMLTLAGIFIIGTITIVLIAWAIPTYVNKEDQQMATHLLIVSSSIFITMVGAMFGGQEAPLSQQPTFTSTASIAGRRKR